eukprot:1157346-Pelagomonas_calceolata.AAC.6
MHGRTLHPVPTHPNNYTHIFEYKSTPSRACTHARTHVLTHTSALAHTRTCAPTHPTHVRRMLLPELRGSLCHLAGDSEQREVRAS